MAITELFRRTNTYIRRRHSPHDADAPILRVTDLLVEYKSGAALQDISFELNAGVRVAVVGPNGAGKSTLFKVIAGVQALTGGRVEISGHEPGGHICIAYLPQRSQVDWSFPVNVADVVMMGRIGKMGLLRWPTNRDWEHVHHSLRIVGMDRLKDRQIAELSGGQQQRMFIARALAQEAELMLMDEPMTGLDIHSQDEIFHILDALSERNVTVMVAMHDLDLAANRFDRVMLLNRRLLGFGSSAEVFEPELLMKAYGGHLRLMQSENGVVILSDTCCEDGPISDERLP